MAHMMNRRGHGALLLLLLLFGAASAEFNGTKHCSDRGGCDCDCSWAPAHCSGDDGSCCYSCCCDPSPPPPPPPSSKTYCPSHDDWSMDESVSWNPATRGWTVSGPGGVHGKTTFNLLGGYVEFDMDTTHATAATNTNFYTSSPEACCAYCDIQPNKSPQCVEMDIIENNGNCAMATTWHTCATNNPSGLQCASEGDCNQGGCAGHMKLPGGPFHIRADFSLDGAMTVRLNGAVVDVSVPSSAPEHKVVEVMNARGAMFHSTQWQGWAPSGSSCPAGGDLHASRFTVSNVTIQGRVVQGDPPAAC